MLLETKGFCTFPDVLRVCVVTKPAALVQQDDALQVAGKGSNYQEA